MTTHPLASAHVLGAVFALVSLLGVPPAIAGAGQVASPVAAQTTDERGHPPVAMPAAATGATMPQPARRQTIGLALGGGAARGISHTGFLRWLEEHRIPVDYIAGTSMGGLVGGAYAAGWTPDELQALMNEADWNLMFLGDSPYRYKNFRRKEDARAFPGLIDFGLKKGLSLPSGLNPGQQIELLLDRIAWPYYDITSFDDLPTPFRCVATDIRRGQSHVLGSGSLSQALRSTMAIPLAFTPVVVGDMLLVDGGTLNNVPADVVKAMGADVAIAVNVSSTTDAAPPANSLFGIVGQTIDAMMSGGTKEALKSADLLVVPDLKGLSGMDWRRADELIDRGYKGAEAMSAALLKYQVDEATYAEWARARQARRRTETPMVSHVRVEGIPEGEARIIGGDLEARHAGKVLDRALLEDSILRISGTDRYEMSGYALRQTADGTELVVGITPKSYGPPFLLPAIDLQNVDSSSFSLNLRLRLAVSDTLVPNSEWRVDLGLGTEQTAAVELYKGLGRTGLFLAPRAYFTRQSINGYQDGDFVAEYRAKRTGAGFDIGYTSGLRSEVRLGYDAVDARIRRRIGPATLPEATGAENVVSLRFQFDGQNSPIVPSRGLRVRAALRYFFDTPDVVSPSGEVLRTHKDVPQGEIAASWFKRVGTRNRLFLSGGTGTSFKSEPGIERYRLGGPFRLGSLNNDEIFGDQYVLGVAGVLREWFRLPDILGGNVYMGGWLEQGSAFDRWEDAEYRASLSVAS